MKSSEALQVVTTASIKPAPISVDRMLMLLKLRFTETLLPTALAFGIVVVINILFLILGKQLLTTGRDNSHMLGWSTIIGILGIILASGTFYQLHRGRPAIDYVLLPASNMEKYATTLFHFLIVFPLFASMLAALSSGILSGISFLITGNWDQLWHPFMYSIWKAFLEYAVMVLMFVAGSAYFRKQAWLKTALSILAAYIVPLLLIFFIQMLWVKLNGNGNIRFADFTIQFDEQGIVSNEGLPATPFFLSISRKTATLLVDIYRLGLLPLFALWFGYNKMSKKELSDEVQ